MGGGEKEGKELIVRVCAQAELALHRCFWSAGLAGITGFGRWLGRIVQQPADAARVRDQFVEVALLEPERKGEKATKMAREAQDEGVVLCDAIAEAREESLGRPDVGVAGRRGTAVEFDVAPV